MESPRHLEGVAREVHDETGVECPIDAFLLAQLCGVDTRPWPRSHGEIVGDLIRYPARARHTRQHGVVAHELGHWLLRERGLDFRDEASARYLAGALMLPRRGFLEDLSATDWDLFAMLAIHVNISAEMCAVRMCQLSPAVATIYDQGHETRRYVGEHAMRDDDADRTLADRALELERPVRGEGAAAWPMLDGAHRRVVVVRRAA